jgi:hypothetical protein
LLVSYGAVRESALNSGLEALVADLGERLAD